MKILAISQPTSGCGYHRIVIPLGYMENVTGTITNAPDEEMMSQKYDLFYFNRLSQYDSDFNALRNKLGCKIIMDIDDSWLLPSNHINYYDYLHLNSRIENNLRESDLVTCTNERLAELIYPLNKNVKIFPNAIPYGSHQFTEDKTEDEKVRIFWCGGVTHEGDLEILKNPIRRLEQYKDKIKMVLGGYDEQNELSKFIWDKMLGYFTSAYKLPFNVLRGTTPDKYMNMYCNADIMVVPLLESKWAGCKSNLKIIEASTKKLPIICQAVQPYIEDINAPVLWVKKQSDWFKHLNFLINDKQAREEYGQKTFEYCKARYDIRNINIERRKAFVDTCQA